MTLVKLNKGIRLQNQIWKLQKIISSIKAYGYFKQDYTLVHISTKRRDEILTIFQAELDVLEKQFAEL